jgi:hypothetical protein
MQIRIESFENNQCYLPIGPAVAQPFLANGNRRVVCWLNAKEKLHSALLPLKDGGHYIMLGTAVLKKTGLRTGSLVEVSLEPDSSEYQFEMPEEFQAVLDTDPQAEAAFRTLTDGSKRTLMHWIRQVKSVDKRIERSLKIAGKMKSGVKSVKEILR